MPTAPQPPLHHVLDWEYTLERVRELLDAGEDADLAAGPLEETPLHIAVRRFRPPAVELLLERGAAIDARTKGGMTPWRHALRRHFRPLVTLLAARGADTRRTPGDELAVALDENDLERAARMLRAEPVLARPPAPEEARLLGDLAGRDHALEAVRLLLDHGADLTARALDGGTPLHVACWFGQPDIAQLLIERGAPLDVSGDDHDSTPLGWVAHGSRFSGGAAERSQRYVRLAELLLAAGASLASPLHPERDPRGGWLLADAAPAVAEVLRRHGAGD